MENSKMPPVEAGLAFSTEGKARAGMAWTLAISTIPAGPAWPSQILINEMIGLYRAVSATA